MISDQLTRPCPWYRDRGLLASSAFTVAVMIYNLTASDVSQQVHGVLAASPMLAAVLVERVSRVAWATLVALIALVIGTLPIHAEWDTSQYIRLGSVVLTGIIGTAAASVRLRNQRQLVAMREVAKTAQRAVMRMTPPQAEGVDAAVRYVSATEAANIGGDAYEALLTPYGLRVLVADARGKGLPAVLSSAVALGAFREWAHEERELTDLIDRMDASVTREVADEDFVTALVAEFSGNRLTYVSAGHPAPVLLRDGHARSLDLQPSPPLSLITEGKRPTVGAILLRRGDVLLMFTDGLADARNEAGQFFAVGAALERVAKDAMTVDECADGLLAELREYIHSDLEDDVAMVALRVTDPVERLTEESTESAVARPSPTRHRPGAPVCAPSRAGTTPGTDLEEPVPYGTVLEPAQLAASPLPTPRGVLSEAVIDLLQRDPTHARGLLPDPNDGQDDSLYGDDSALALYCSYELHYRGFDGVDDRWEWHPELLRWRQQMEALVEERIADEVGTLDEHPKIPQALHDLRDAASAPSLSGYLLEKGTVEQLTEMAVHRSAYQLKEADPHTWAIPRLSGVPKAAAVEIQADEYGAGVARDMHQNLFGLTLAELGLDPSYNAYLDVLPGSTLAGVNAVSMFGLHRRWLGACVGHLAMFEMTSVEPMGATAAALRRLGFGSDARHFYSVHVVADAHHQHVAADRLAAGLVEQDERWAQDVLFGAATVMALEGEAAGRTLAAWDAGRSSLLTL